MAFELVKESMRARGLIHHGTVQGLHIDVPLGVHAPSRRDTFTDLWTSKLVEQEPIRAEFKIQRAPIRQQRIKQRASVPFKSKDFRD